MNTDVVRPDLRATGRALRYLCFQQLSVHIKPYNSLANADSATGSTDQHANGSDGHGAIMCN
jgi:hypothetical protein